MGPAEVRQYCPLDDSGKRLLRAAMTQLGMSARAFHRIVQLFAAMNPSGPAGCAGDQDASSS